MRSNQQIKAGSLAPVKERPQSKHAQEESQRRARVQKATSGDANLKNYAWTKEEINFLKTNRHKLTKKQIARALGRTYYAVRSKMAMPNKERKMSKDELVLREIIRELGIGVREFARELKIPESTFSDFINYGRLPKRWEQEGIKTKIKEKLLEMGISRKDIFNRASAVAVNNSRVGRRPQAPMKEEEGEMLTGEAMKWFGMEEDPFDRAAVKSEADIFQTPSYKKTKAAIEKAITKRQFVAVWGAVGCGKTLLWTAIHDSIKDNEKIRVVKPLTIEKEKLTIHNLEEAFILDLRAARPDYEAPLRSSREARDRQVRELLYLYDSEGIAVVLVIEEAHTIPMRTLKALKRLHEIQYGFSQPLTIILLGQPELMEIKGDLRVREVSRRCRFLELASLRKPEMKAYITWKFSRVKASPQKIFSENAWEALSRKFARQASALQVNNLVAFALNKAEEVKKKKIDGAFIDALD